MSKKKLSIVDKLKLKLKQDKKQNTLFIKEKVFFEIPVIKKEKKEEEE
tara:strand:+ start:455 stop:598 length:144 start_codon:yes stop_codon:yes gene_type:complete